MAWVAPVVAAVISAAGTAYSASQQAKANRNQRNAAAAAGMGGGGSTPGNYQPTALQAEAKGGIGDMSQMGLGDVLGQKTMEAPTYEPPKSGFSDDAKPPGAKDSDFHDFASKQDQQPPKDNTSSYLNSASQLAGTIGQLAQRPQVAPLPIPQPGPMNFTPTALAMLARRGPYGGGY